MLWQAGGLAWLRGQRRPRRGADHRGLRAVPAGDPARAARLRRAPVHAAPGRLTGRPTRSRCWSRPATRAARCCRRWRCWRRRSPATSPRPGGCGRAGAARWSATGPATSPLYLQAESALWLGDEPEWAAAAESLLPYRGRQAVLGTPSLTLGAYDELLGRIAERRGDLGGARAVVAGRPASRACWSAHRTRWRWPSRTSPASRVRPRPPSDLARGLQSARSGACGARRQRVVAMPPSTAMTEPVT